MSCPGCKKKIDKKSKFCPWCGSNIVMEEKHERCYWIRRLLVAVTIMAGFFCIFFIIVAIQKKKEAESENNSINLVDDIQKFSNGDYVYNPSEDTVKYDEENYVIYYDELLIVYLDNNISSEERNALVKLVDGELVGNLSGCMNVIEIKVDHAEYLELEKKAEKLMEDETVLYADVEMPMTADSSVSEDQNPWEADTDVHNEKNHDGNEKEPGGNDWWAEPIEAYTAWQYIDSGQVDITDMKIGVIDNGIDEDHEEFQRNGKSKIHFLEDFSQNVPADHGTHVTGIIAAENNSVGIRGVMDKAEIFFSSWSAEELLSTGKFIEATKQMIENDVKVINNSWTLYWMDQEKYEEQFWKDGTFVEKLRDKLDVWILDMFKCFDGVYDEYVKMMNNSTKRGAYQVMAMMTELFLNGKDQVLFVESAGNGYNNGDKGYPSYMAGYYCAVTQENFDALNKKGTLSKLGYDYETFKNHIMIVGATERVLGKSRLTEFSNYGKYVDIVAPGKNIYSTLTIKDDDQDNEYNYYDGKSYGEMQGTSMAAPMVTGAAALLWEVEPQMTAKEIKDILINTAGTAKRYAKSDERKEYPLLNIGTAMKWLVEDGYKEAFKKVIEQEEEKYGRYTPQTMGNVQYASGVCYLELRDVDRDERDELFLVYNTNEKDEYGSLYSDDYQYELWKYKKGQAVLLEKDGLYYSNGSFPWICWTEYQNRTYLVTNYQNVLSYWFHRFKKDGSFGVTDIFLKKYADSVTDIFINGQQVTLDEWLGQCSARMENAQFINLFYAENTHANQQHDEYDMVGAVKAKLTE